MAKLNVEEVVKVVDKKYTLELSRNELRAIALLCYHTGGHYLESLRKYTDSILQSIGEEVGYKNYNDCSLTENAHRLVDGSINFKNGEWKE